MHRKMSGRLCGVVVSPFHPISAQEPLVRQISEGKDKKERKTHQSSLIPTGSEHSQEKRSFGQGCASAALENSACFVQI